MSLVLKRLPANIFDPVFAHLHDEILSYLSASPTIHAILRLLGFSRHFRKLAAARLALLREFTKNKLRRVDRDDFSETCTLMLTEGGFVKVRARRA